MCPTPAFPPPGPSGRFPGFTGTVQALRLPAAHPAPLRCLRERGTTRPPGSMPSAPTGTSPSPGTSPRVNRTTTTRRPGDFLCRPPPFPAICLGWRRLDLPGSLENPNARMPRSQTPVEPPRLASDDVSVNLHATFRRLGTAFRYMNDVGFHNNSLSRLNHAACDLAVYASQPGSPRHHARLASAQWPTGTGRAGYLRGSSTRSFGLASLLHLLLATALPGALMFPTLGSPEGAKNM